MINLMEQLDQSVAYVGKRVNWRLLVWLVAVPVGFGVVVLLFTKSDTFGGLVLSVPAIALMVFAFLVYFLPATIAYKQKKINKEAILVLNIFLGWTVVGWVVALVWASTKSDASKSVIVTLPSVLCASCGKYSSGGGSFCSHCGGRL